MVCGNPDEHPSLSPEHCTVAPNVKTDNFNRIVFSAERVAGRGQANVKHSGPPKVFLRCGEQNVLHRGVKIG
jgi:hypothetical protein